MKNSGSLNWMKVVVFLFIALTTLMHPVKGQEQPIEDDGNKEVRSPFESTWIIDNQTVVIPSKKTLEFMIQHRFGVVNNGATDLWGLYAPSNIRLALSYTLFDNIGFGYLKGPLAIGIGTTKNNMIQDINLKFGFLRQTRNGRIPVSVSYYFNTGIETVLPEEDLPNGNKSDRVSYFHQLLISRKFSEKISVQLSPSVSHYNTVEPGRYNDHFAVAISGRYKFSAQSSLLINVDQPITAHESNNPQPNVSFGIEVSTSAHSFQIFVTNFNSIVPQRNNFFNQNDPWSGDFVIGFNINRLWNF